MHAEFMNGVEAGSVEENIEDYLVVLLREKGFYDGDEALSKVAA